MHRLIFVILTLLPHLGYSSNLATDLKLQQLNNENFRFRFDDGSEEAKTESFDGNVLTFDTISETALDKICRNPDVIVFIVQDELRIDCREYTTNYDYVPIPRVIVKRDVDELDGSGNGADGDNAEEEKKVASGGEEKGESEKKIDEEKKEEDEEMKEEKNDGENKNVSVGVEVKSPVDVPTTVVEEEQPAPVEVTQDVKETTKSEDVESKETPAPVASSVDEGPETTPPNPPENDNSKMEAAPLPPVPIPESPKVDEVPKTPDVPPTDPKKEETSPKQIETVMAVGENVVKNDEIAPQFQPKDEATKKGKSLAEPPNDSDKSKTNVGESTADTKKASKDTSILIFLFVAVVVVGALAFGYNFIKKRKQQSADLERAERGPSAIKRSLQSLTKTENEPEMKPLIPGSPGSELEMVEIKTTENGDGGRAKNTENVDANKT